MDYSKLQKMFKTFPDRATSQLKYYVLTSFFPQLSKKEIKQIAGISDNGLAPIMRTVESYNLEPLSQILAELNLINCADATLNLDQKDVTPQVDNTAELQSKLDKLEEELKTARETILYLKNEMEEKDFLYSKSKSSYMEENVRLRKDVEYLQCELRKKQLVEPLQFKASHSNNSSRGRIPSPEPVFTPEELGLE